MHRVFLILFLPLFLLAQEAPTEHKTPQQIEQELKAAEAHFEKAKKMFNPYYTGPLLTPSASMMPVGVGYTEPYLFVIDNYAAFDKERASVSLPNNLIQLQGTANIQTGITNNFDLNLTFSGFGNWQNGHSGGGFGDTSLSAGFLIYKQTRYVPGARLAITQTFPTGKYKSLNTNGFLLDAIGAGAYSTQFCLAFSKLLFWTTQHPMSVRLFFGYKLSTIVNVKGFNTYGGGFGTMGRVRPGNNFSTDLGVEVSLTQKWVAAIDLVYTATNATKFHGISGTLSDGTPAAVGTGYSDNLSLSPAFEYNWNENIGIIGGAWFSVYGRNSSNFAAGVIAFSYLFP